MAVVDFTNPAACDWYSSHLKRLMDMGVDNFKTDFAERIPVKGVKYHDNSSPERMHNYYALLYNRIVYNTLSEKVGPAQGLLFVPQHCIGRTEVPSPLGRRLRKYL